MDVKSEYYKDWVLPSMTLDEIKKSGFKKYEHTFYSKESALVTANSIVGNGIVKDAKVTRCKDNGKYYILYGEKL